MTKKKDDPFESPKRQLKRGKRDLARLKKRFQTFIRKVRTTQIIEQNADGGERLVKFRLSRRIPPSWDESAYGIVDALRSALDQTGYAAAVAAGKVKPKKTQFPIGDDPAGLNNTIIGYKACKDIPNEIVALFRSFQPYKGGNDAVWALNKLRHSFHTAIVPVTMHSGGMHVKEMRISGSGQSRIFIPRWDADKNEIILASIAPTAEFHYKGTLIVTITFDKIDFLPGSPIFDVLGRMAAEVECILLATEAECRRLGFIS